MGVKVSEICKDLENRTVEMVSPGIRTSASCDRKGALVRTKLKLSAEFRSCPCDRTYGGWSIVQILVRCPFSRWGWVSLAMPFCFRCGAIIAPSVIRWCFQCCSFVLRRSNSFLSLCNKTFLTSWLKNWLVICSLRHFVRMQCNYSRQLSLQRLSIR